MTQNKVIFLDEIAENVLHSSKKNETSQKKSETPPKKWDKILVKNLLACKLVFPVRVETIWCQRCTPRVRDIITPPYLPAWADQKWVSHLGKILSHLFLVVSHFLEDCISHLFTYFLLFYVKILSLTNWNHGFPCKLL